MATIANLTTYIAGESSSFLSSIESSRGALRRLLSELDPAAAATAKFNNEQQLLDNALKRGTAGFKTQAIGIEEHRVKTEQLRARYEQQIGSINRVTQANTQSRMGMQQLSFQLNDIATMYAMGARPMQIFASQAGHVAQAIQMASGGTSAFARFLGGPWGLALTTATVALAPFVAKLFEGETATKKMALASDGLSDAQAVLGQMFDLNSGKLKKMNDLLLLNIKLTELQLRNESLQKRDEAMKFARGVGPSLTTMMIAPWFAEGGDATVMRDANRLRNHVRGTVEAVLAGRKDASAVLDRFTDKDLASLNITAQDYRDALVAATESRYKGITADEIRKTLETGKLSAVFRNPETERKPKSDKDAERAAREAEEARQRFETQMEAFRREQLQDQLAITTDLEERAALQADLNLMEFEERKRQILNEKNYTEEQKTALIDLLKKRYGAEGGDELLVGSGLSPFLAKQAQAQQAELIDQDLAMKRAAMEIQMDALRDQLDQARTQRERRRISLEILDQEKKMARAALEAVIAKEESTKTEKNIARAKLAALDAEYKRKSATVERQTMGPLETYIDGMIKDAGELNEAYENIAVDGLRSLNDGITEAIMGSKSLGEAFSQVAKQIVADLIRIMIQQTLIKPLAEALLPGGGGGGGLSSIGAGLGKMIPGIFSILGGGGGGGIAPGLASGGSFDVGGLPGTDRNLLSINGQPRAWVSDTERLHVTPANDRGGPGGGRNLTQIFNNNGVMTVSEFWAQVQAMSDAAQTGAVTTVRRDSIRAAQRSLRRR
ncbi:phage tail length tape measure family protein [Sphingomonas canadensis]|uniref:Phage tail length tape measure family protein n=1 Tax=Sphingomonas canadensis TaxID=1219257 RepID=A0ABW3H9D5_9SPHN|nr:phage tail length tape measure family protein [Sphingomonas canadensis]MCW3837802.1 phage tail length tape measure family protein [Sphingomonas canadensis]